ncbi:MAG: uroporphyrinogen-III C-methyltransferase [Proteobacteria bacterium]|jgi:uroporphyrin-3 C-methyltransferase|nr:uroporphyrinogen-III C-methyltransferase [Pseudomonadota bacterium]
MNSPTSSHDDSLPESGIMPEQLPAEPSSVPPANEPTTSASAPELPAVPPVSASAPANQRGGRGAVGWALLLALLSIGFAGFALWQAYEWRAQGENLRKEVAERLRESDQAVGESRASAKREHESLDTILAKIGALEGQLSKSEGHAVALEALYQQFSRSQEERVVAEVQQAVEFAGQQLQYAGNIEMALIVLREAQARLEQNDHGQFSALRQALKTDIEKLSRQDTFDMPRTAERLEHVLGKIDALPLAYHGEVPDGEASVRSIEKNDGEGVAHFIRALATDVWEELRSLVKFERLDKNDKAVLLAPEQSAFLRENVKMRLLTARLAMLARDGHTYGVDLEQARNWIERFFDMGSKDVKEVVEELRTLESMPVGVIRNELIESAAAVGRFRTRRAGEPSSPPGQPPVLPDNAPAAPEAVAPSAQP